MQAIILIIIIIAIIVIVSVRAGHNENKKWDSNSNGALINRYSKLVKHLSSHHSSKIEKVTKDSVKISAINTLFNIDIVGDKIEIWMKTTNHPIVGNTAHRWVFPLNYPQEQMINELENKIKDITLDHILQKNSNNRNQIIDSLIDKMAALSDDDDSEKKSDNSITYNNVLISEKLLEGVLRISKTAVEGLKSNQDEKRVLCESIMLISSIVVVQIFQKVKDNDRTEMLSSEYLIPVREYFKDNHSDLFEDDFSVDEFVDNRISIYTYEIAKYLVDKEFAFPKTTYCIYISPMDKKVDNHFGVENMEINLCIPIWMKALDMPIDILLLLK